MTFPPILVTTKSRRSFEISLASSFKKNSPLLSKKTKKLKLFGRTLFKSWVSLASPEFPFRKTSVEPDLASRITFA